MATKFQRIISPYGQCVMIRRDRSSSADSRASTIVENVFARSKIGPKLFTSPGKISESVASAKIRWRKERINELDEMHRKFLVILLKILKGHSCGQSYKDIFYDSIVAL